VTDPLLKGMALEPGGWVRIGSRRSGHVMRSLAFMRIERTLGGWRAWDVIRPSAHRIAPQGRPYEPETVHKTLAQAKAHCERVVDAAKDCVPDEEAPA